MSRVAKRPREKVFTTENYKKTSCLHVKKKEDFFNRRGRGEHGGRGDILKMALKISSVNLCAFV